MEKDKPTVIIIGSGLTVGRAIAKVLSESNVGATVVVPEDKEKRLIKTNTDTLPPLPENIFKDTVRDVKLEQNDFLEFKKTGLKIKKKRRKK